MEWLVARLRALSRPERRLAGAVLSVLAVVAVASVLATRDTRVSLFAEPLAPDQVTEVVTRLALWDAPFVAETENVRVDASARNNLLLRLSLAGLPHRHLASSSEALAKSSPLAPPSVLEAQAREGLEGDLAASLRGIAGIDDAHVIIAPGMEAVFAGDQLRGSSASVRLALSGGPLSSSTIAGIRSFIAAAVPGLESTHVAILDDRGSPLGDDTESTAGEALALQASLQSALDAAFGPHATIVRVRVAYDPRARELREVRREPLGTRAIGVVSSDERFASANRHYVKSHASEDRGSDVRDEHTETPGGRLERISVAVAVDAHRGLDLTKIHALADATLGLVPQHGDAIRVEAIPFVVEPEPAPPGLATAIGLLASIAPAMIVGFVIVVVSRATLPPLIGAIERVIGRITLGRATRAVAGFAPAHVRGALRDEPPHTAAAIISALPAATASAVLEMYSPEERAAIVQRMQRATSPAVPDYESVLRRA